MAKAALIRSPKNSANPPDRKKPPSAQSEPNCSFLQFRLKPFTDEFFELRDGKNGCSEEFLGAAKIPVAGDEIVGVGGNGTGEELGVLLITGKVELLVDVETDGQV